MSTDPDPPPDPLAFPKTPTPSPGETRPDGVVQINHGDLIAMLGLRVGSATRKIEARLPTSMDRLAREQRERLARLNEP